MKIFFILKHVKTSRAGSKHADIDYTQKSDPNIKEKSKKEISLYLFPFFYLNWDGSGRFMGFLSELLTCPIFAGIHMGMMAV